MMSGTKTWSELNKKIEDYSKDFKTDKKLNESQYIFERFAKYYLLADLSYKSLYRNVWLNYEIPKEVLKKIEWNKKNKDYSILLEDKKGNFIPVKVIYDNDQTKELNILSDSNFLLFTNTQTKTKNDDVNIDDLNNTKSYKDIISTIKNDAESSSKSLKESLGLYRYSLKAMKLVWDTSPQLTILLALLTLIGGLLPAVMAYIGKLIIDSVIEASKIGSVSGFSNTHWLALKYLGLEAIIIILLEAVRRGLSVCQSLLRALLGQKVNVLILEKSLTLDLSHFENSEFYDKMTKARREASSRPLSLVNRTFSIVQSIISLTAYGFLLLNFSPMAVLILVIASIPSFVAETKFASQAFRIFSWRAPEAREQMYLETLIAREDHAKEVKLFQLGNMMLDRYKAIFNRLYIEDKDLTIKRGFWGYLFSMISSISFYGAYAWIVIETMAGKISIGEMTMYLTVFRQGQGTLSGLLGSIGGMYEDNLYLSSLYDFLEQKTESVVSGKTKGSNPQDGIKFENVSFSYPGSGKTTLKNISLHVRPGEKLAIVGGNGSGKTTLIKLMTKLYSPNSGRITLDGVDLEEWDIDTLHKRIGVIFQNFVHYQFTVGENIGVGDVTNLDDEDRWFESSEKGMSLPFIQDMPAGFRTQLGNWFKGGQELSLGQWQKIALSRAFMRKSADILVLDEPTSAIDAEAEVQIFEHFKSVTKEQMVFLISHRFSTVRMADKIIVLEKGEITEGGTHNDLIKADGRYAKLFNLQAAGYL